MNYPTYLTISDVKMEELKQRIIAGIKKNLPAARHLCGINNEIAMGIYIYAVEELGKLISLRNCQKQSGEYIIEYAKKYRKHPVKFKQAFDHLQENDKSDCIVLNDEGGFEADSFSWESFDIGLLPETEARLGAFYVDLDYNSTNKVTDIKNIPSVDENRLRTAIDCLKGVIDNWRN